MKKTAILIFTVCFIYNSFAQDRHFAWSYNSPTLPKGSVDVEVWNTFSTGRKDYFYKQLHQRLEFEFGVTDGIQTSFYLNAKHRGVGPRDLNAAMALTTNSSYSFSNAWKFYLFNPFDNPLGASVYLEYYLSPGETEIEGKLMLDKITEDHWFVFNSTFELELKNEFEKEVNEIKTETGAEWKWENTFGYLYQLNQHLGVGIEVRNINALNQGTWEYSSVFVGPTIFIGSTKYFFMFNAMPQIANLKGDNKPLELNDQERFAFRVLLGVTL